MFGRVRGGRRKMHPKRAFQLDAVGNTGDGHRILGQEATGLVPVEIHEEQSELLTT
jgi:hypothetical protein